MRLQRRFLVMLCAATLLLLPQRVRADMELAPPPQADFESSRPEMSDPPAADYEVAAPQPPDDPPADYERAAPEPADAEMANPELSDD